MRKEKNPLLLVDLPEYVIQNYMINDDLSVHQQARRALEKALPRYLIKKVIYETNGEFPISNV